MNGLASEREEKEGPKEPIGETRKRNGMKRRKKEEKAHILLLLQKWAGGSGCPKKLGLGASQLKK